MCENLLQFLFQHLQFKNFRNHFAATQLNKNLNFSLTLFQYLLNSSTSALWFLLVSLSLSLVLPALFVSHFSHKNIVNIFEMLIIIW